MDNLVQQFSHKPILAVVLAISIIVVTVSIPYFLKQNRLYGSYFEFAAPSKKILTGLSCLAIIAITLYGLTPYTPPASDEIAIVIGNTQNTPAPRISGYVSQALEETMLQHKGEDAAQIANSIKIISAAKHPELVMLDPTELKLREIGNNSSNARRNAGINAKAIIEKITTSTPSEAGANYLEAILEARNNVQEGAKIIVIGSGLSDSGDLNFSQTNILTNEQSRKDTVQEVKKKYGYDYFDGYAITFYGLGDTVPPQEALSNKQKQVVRGIYQNAVIGMGGQVDIDTATLSGNPVVTDYIVGTTDTGCGDIGLVFDDENLKFASNQAIFKDAAAAKNNLTTIKDLWDEYGDAIQMIQVDGFIAHYAGPDNLSQQRADLVKSVLIELGVPTAKVSAIGRGFGPYEQDVQNRIVKVTISRDSDQCSN